MTEQNVTACVETITPELAKKYLEFNTVNRPVKKKIVDFYAEQMRKGQWILNGESICFSRNGQMVNGQHRLHAVIQYGKGVDFLVVRGCPNESLKTYDTGAIRTLSDIFALAGVPNYNSVSSIVNKYLGLSYNLSLAVRGADHSTGDRIKQEKKMSKKDILDEYYKHSQIWQEIYKAADNIYSTVRLMATSEIGGMMAFLYLDKKHDLKKVVFPFFDMLFNGNNVCNPVINLLRSKLIKDVASSKKMTGKAKSALITKTWNCYITGRVLKTLSYNEEKEGQITFL